MARQDTARRDTARRDTAQPDKAPPGRQLLHLVFGGELTDLDDVRFKSVADLDIVGLYPNYAAAYDAWRAAAQRTVDNAQMRYFIVHIHRLLDPATGRSVGES